MSTKENYTELPTWIVPIMNVHVIDTKQVSTLS